MMAVARRTSCLRPTAYVLHVVASARMPAPPKLHRHTLREPHTLRKHTQQAKSTYTSRGTRAEPRRPRRARRNAPSKLAELGQEGVGDAERHCSASRLLGCSSLEPTAHSSHPLFDLLERLLHVAAQAAVRDEHRRVENRRAESSLRASR